MKPTLATLLLLAAALAGCAQSTAPETTSSVPTATATDLPQEIELLVLTVNPPAATQNETLTLTGTVSRAAQVSVGAEKVQAEGSWSLAVAVAFGRTNLTVLADDGTATASANITAIRLASATVEIHYNTLGKQDTVDLVWYDPSAFASAVLYAGRDVAHPPHANVHDLMVTWTQATGVEVVYGYSNGIGFSVQSIDGVGTGLGIPTLDNSYWCYEYNGASADFGITSQELQPGDAVLWGLGCQ